MAGLRSASLLSYVLVANLVSAYRIEHVTIEIPQYDVIVVGCGISGLAALTRLVTNGARVLCLEAESRVGGRINTQRYGSGVAEFGAEWIHGKDGNVVYDLAASYNMTPPTPSDVAFEFYSGNGSRPNREQCDEMSSFLFNEYDSISDSGDGPPQTIKTYLSKKFEEYVEHKPHLQKEKTFWDSFYLWFMKSATLNDAVDNYDLMSTKSVNDYIDCGGPPNYSWGSRGYWTLFDILLQKTGDHPLGIPVNIKLNKEVVEVNWLPDKPTDVVSVQTADGDRYTASTVISTVSLGVLQHRYKELFKPGLPLAKQNAINLLDMGTVNKILLRYDHAFWENDKVIGLIWSDEDVAALSEDDKWLAECVSASGSEGSPNVLTFWLSGEAARNMESIPLDDLTVKMNFILDKFLKPHYPNLPPFKELRRTTWSSDPHFRGSYSYHGLRSDAEEDPTQGLREPLLDASSGTPRLLFAGEATHQHYYATVNGGLRSGWREADRVLAWRYRRLFQPMLPPAKIVGISLPELGIVDKVILSYDRAYWGGVKKFSFLWVDEDIKALSGDKKWLAEVYTATVPEGSENLLTFWIVEEVVKQMEAMPTEELKKDLD